MEIIIQYNDAEVNAQLIGRLDTAASRQAAIDMAPLIDNAEKVIVLDCSKLEFISSSGLRLLLTLRKQTITKGGKVEITGMTSVVKEVFNVTGFSSFFEFK